MQMGVPYTFMGKWLLSAPQGGSSIVAGQGAGCKAPTKKGTGARGVSAFCLVWMKTGKDQPTTVTLVMWGLTPSYQYRKPSMSMVWPTSRFFTAAYTSVVLSHR